MILQSCGWLIVTLVIGFGFLGCLGLIRLMPMASFLAAVCLAAGLGLGLSSVSFFVSSLATSPRGQGFIVGEVGLLLVFVVGSIYSLKYRQRAGETIATATAVNRRKPLWFLRLAFLIVLVSAASAVIALSFKEPYGEWDAMFHWNLHAKFIFRGGDHWRDAFSPLLSESNPDYPLLIPMTVVRGWRYIGEEAALIPVLVAILFTFATVGLTCCSLAILRSGNQAFLAGLVLLGVPFLITHGASQYADVPIAFFFLATIVSLCLNERLPHSSQRLTFLAGTTAGLACWTKNEGLLFVVSLVIARTAVLVRSEGWARPVTEMRGFCFGLSPILAIVLYFKSSLAGPGLLSTVGVGTVYRLIDVHRYVGIFQGFKKVILSFGNNPLLSPVWLLCLYLACVGVKIESRDKGGIIAATMTIGFMLTGYAFVLLIHPPDVSWNIAGTLDRLLLQLWPAMVFTYFLVACPLEEAPVV